MKTWIDLSDEEREPYQAKASALLVGLYGCRRVWTAWQVGTMTERDFCRADEDADIVDNVAAGLYAAAVDASKQINKPKECCHADR